MNVNSVFIMHTWKIKALYHRTKALVVIWRRVNTEPTGFIWPPIPPLQWHFSLSKPCLFASMLSHSFSENYSQPLRYFPSKTECSVGVFQPHPLSVPLLMNCVCVCVRAYAHMCSVCVCVREREREETDRQTGTERETHREYVSLMWSAFSDWLACWICVWLLLLFCYGSCKIFCYAPLC